MGKLRIRTGTTEPETTAASAPVVADVFKRGDLKSKEYLRLRASIAIDKQDLDTCVEQQPQLYGDVAERTSELLSERDKLEEELKRLDSNLADGIRAEALRSKESITVGAVNDKVMQHALHISRQEEYAAKKSEADLWQKLLNTYEQRAKMLQIEAQLYSSGYFMTNVGKSASTRVRDADADNARAILDAQRKSRRA